MLSVYIPLLFCMRFSTSIFLDLYSQLGYTIDSYLKQTKIQYDAHRWKAVTDFIISNTIPNCICICFGIFFSELKMVLSEMPF